MRARTTKDYNIDPQDDNLNIHGRPKKGVVSFQIEEKVWQEFDKYVEEQYGRYKKSLIIENLIKRYMAQKSDNNKDNKDNKKYLI